MKYFLLVLIATLSLPALAEQAKTLEHLQQEEKLRNALDTLDQLDTRINAMTRRREADCAKAIGYAPFCDCISRNLPVAWSFAEYLAITTRTKDENGYEKLDAEFRTAYDKVPSVRDKCVRLINTKP